MSNFIKVVEYFNTTEICRRIKNESISVNGSHVRPTAIIEKWEAVSIFIATGILAMLLAFVFEYIRHNVYMSTDNLDATFHAGGHVNAGLTATTVVSQWTWSSSLLHSTTIAVKYGISGSFWYAAGASIQIILFSMLAVQLKTQAPGAKTFLQVIKARFGEGTHIVFCIFALVTNIFVTCIIMLGGGVVITTLVHDISLEYALVLVAAVIGGYTFVGGLGATIYVSYFNTTIIYVILLILIFKVYGDHHSELLSIGSISRVYHYVSCAKGPDGNEGNSYLTFISEKGLMYGIINIIVTFGTVIVDQSFWQCAVAAKPKQGAVSFILAGLAWFAIPFSLSTAMGLGYIAMSAEQGSDLLSMQSINEGLIVPTVVSRLLGKTGAILVFVMILVAIISTGAAEVMAVTSILVYDVYAPYFKPFRTIHLANTCILCGKAHGRMDKIRDPCRCISFNYCAHCFADTKARQECRVAVKPKYTCRTHGLYRSYTDKLNVLKSWAFVWVNMSIIPLTLMLDAVNVGLNFTYTFMGVVIGSAVVPITLSMFWEKLTATGMVTGAVSGTCLSLVSWIVGASIQEGGLGNFRENAGKEEVMLLGNLVAISFGGLTAFVVTVLQHEDLESVVFAEIWEETRDIDNPLAPWTDIYREELGVIDIQHLNNRPSLKETQKTFANVKAFAKWMSLFTLLFLLLVLPVTLTAVGLMDLWEFTVWIKLSQVWASLAAAFVIIIPFGIEAWDIGFTMHKPRIKKSELLGSHGDVFYRASTCATAVSTEPIDGTDDEKPTLLSDMGSYHSRLNP